MHQSIPSANFLLFAPFLYLPQEKSYSQTSKHDSLLAAALLSSMTDVIQSPTSLSKSGNSIQTPTDLSKSVTMPEPIKSVSQAVSSASLAAISRTNSPLPQSTVNSIVEEDEEDDEEGIQTESIREARLVRKKQRPSSPSPTAASVPREGEAQINQVKNAAPVPPVPGIQGPEDSSAEGETDTQPDPPAGLGKVGTALLSVGGVLMVAGITGGIFVWRAAQQQHGRQDPPDSTKLQVPAINLLDLEAKSPASPVEAPEFATQQPSGLDFNYSMEKLFNNTTRQRPVSQPAPPPVIANPAHVSSIISEEKVQIDNVPEEEASVQDLYAASPISIYFPSTSKSP
jgi:hypothetical protein